MRFFSFTTIAALSATVLAQGASDIPKCAQACFGGSNLGTCAATDLACICGNSAVIDKVSCCIFATCPPDQIAAITQLAQQLCKLQNVNVNTAPSCASGSATPSDSSAMPSGSAAPSGSATSSVGNGTASATASATSTMTVPINTGGASLQLSGAGIGLGAIVAGLLAVF